MSDIRSFHDYEDGRFIFGRIQDVEPILDFNKAAQNEPQKSESFRHIARIPAVILEKWCNDDGVNYLALPKREFNRLVMRKLRSSEWMYLRTSPGSI